MFNPKVAQSAGIFVVIAMTSACTSTPRDQTAGPLAEPDSVINHKADSLYVLGERDRKKALFDSAAYYHELALKLRQSRRHQDDRLAYSYWKSGRALFAQVKLNVANQRHDMAIALADSFNLPFDTLVTIYLNAALVKSEMLDVTSSLSLVTHAMTLVRAKEPLNRTLLVQCYRALAHVNFQTGNYEEALRNQWSLRKIADGISSKRTISEMALNTALAMIALARYDSVLYFIDKSLELRIELFGPVSDPVSSCYLNKGDYFRRLRLYDSAIYYFRKNLAIRLATLGETDPRTAGAMEALGDAFHELGSFDSAIVYRQGLLSSQIEGFEGKDFSTNPKPREEEITMDLVDYLVDKGITLHSMYFSDTTRLPALVASLRTFQLADSIYAVYQSNLQFEELALSQLNEDPVPYSMMMDVTGQLYRSTGDKQFLEDALQIMERSKAVALKNALTRARSFEELGLPDNLAAGEKALLQHRSGLVHLLTSEYGKGKRDSINEEIFKVDKEYNNLKSAIAREQPNYHLLNYGSNITLDRLTSIMTKNDALWVDYLWGDDKLFILSVSSSEARLHEVPIDVELLSRIRSMATTIHSFDDSSYTASGFHRFVTDAHFLFLRLLEPALEARDVSRLVISPAGSLMAFPFEVLVRSMPVSDEIDYHLDYIVNTYDISYEYSGSFMEHQVSGDRHGDKLLAVGFAALDDRGDTGHDLPGAREELEAIKVVMGNNSNRYLLDNDGSEAEFKSSAEQFNLLHLAVHGTGDTVNSMKSHLEFRGQAAGQDGKLYAHELYALDLRSVDLAVLSACESGVGRFQRGEGVMSIARGFRYAGCPSLIMSLWKVSDKRSADIMSRFYSAISEGTRIDNALATAKRSYLADVNVLNAHPFYWAAFLSVGDTSPVSRSMRTSTILIIALAGLALSLVWIAWRRRTSRLEAQVQRG
jgi:CHAT domain-containing protein